MPEITRIQPLATLALCLALSACGGGGGSVASTPPPTSTGSVVVTVGERLPTPPIYTKIADMSGDRTFQTAGIQYTVGLNVNGTNPQTLAFGNGPQVRYTASDDSYTVTDTSGNSSTFNFTNLVTNPAPPAGVVQYRKTTGTTVEQFSLSVPSVNGVPLSYTVLGSWLRADTTTTIGTAKLGFGGAPTQSSDVPRTGNANYSTGIGGALTQNGTTFSLNANSTATFSANFAANSVTTSMTLAGLPPVLAGSSVAQFGTYTGSGTISGNGISGTLSGGSMSGAFSGSFFGPQAAEFGAGWYLNGTIAGVQSNAVGAVYGIKQ